MANLFTRLKEAIVGPREPARQEGLTAAQWQAIYRPTEGRQLDLYQPRQLTFGEATPFERIAERFGGRTLPLQRRDVPER